MFDFYKSLSDNASSTHWSYNPALEIEKDIECPICKTRRNDVIETGYVGCSNCYKVFSEDIEMLAMNIFGKKQHVGRIPASETSKKMCNEKIDRLERQLRQAVDIQDFETAIVLKAKINKVKEQELGGRK
ncbi:MAG: UvrB/UvrC motif-containing protein [Clostridia bacterium]